MCTCGIPGAGDRAGAAVGRVRDDTAKGRDAAGLGVDLTNPTGAYRLYESLGMYPVYETDIYERTVSGTRGAGGPVA
jgi:hypothetical protein